MARYSEERKQAAIEKMMPPQKRPISELAKETGISDVTLYHWRKQARARGMAVSGDGRNPENWSPEDKFTVVVDAIALNEAELAEYCRRKGLFVEQIAAWKQACIQGTMADAPEVSREQARRDRKRIRQLEGKLRHKEKALAETAALLVLRKKAEATWYWMPWSRLCGPDAAPGSNL